MNHKFSLAIFILIFSIFSIGCGNKEQENSVIEEVTLEQTEDIVQLNATEESETTKEPTTDLPQKTDMSAARSPMNGYLLILVHYDLLQS